MIFYAKFIPTEIPGKNLKDFIELQILYRIEDVIDRRIKEMGDKNV